MNCSLKRVFILMLSSLLIISWSAGQVTTIQGKVTDKETGEPLVGVNVTIRDQLTGTVTNAYGSFTLITQVPRPFFLIISMLGYQSQEFEIDDDMTELEIQMLEHIYLGQEVIICASGSRESIMKSPVRIEKI